jgi:hypothetical protein
MKVETFDQLQKRIPERIIEHAVRGMLPKGWVKHHLLSYQLFASVVHAVYTYRHQRKWHNCVASVIKNYDCFSLEIERAQSVSPYIPPSQSRAFNLLHIRLNYLIRSCQVHFPLHLPFSLVA